MPSFNCVITSRAWFAAALPDLTKGELCAATSVMLPYFREHNSG